VSTDACPPVNARDIGMPLGTVMSRLDRARLRLRLRLRLRQNMGLAPDSPVNTLL
jgi:hypothetical protein